MKQILYIILLITASVSCSKNDGDVPPSPPIVQIRDTVPYTWLVYMAADNNLSDSLPPYRVDNSSNNIEAILSGAQRDGLNGGNLIIYRDSRKSSLNPDKNKVQLLEVVRNEAGNYKTNTLYQYENENSASPEVLNRVIQEMKYYFPARKYGIILWSHATNWLPKKIEYDDQIQALQLKPESPVQGYTFGVDGADEMPISELADAIPDNLFHTIMFDACYMGSVEVAYELRNKATFLIASPSEVLLEGLPYNDIIGDMFATDNRLQEICEKYMLKYRTKSLKSEQSATTSLIYLPEMESLAKKFKSIVANHDYKNIVISDLQHFDRLKYRLMFDLQDYIKRIATDSEMQDFKNQIDKTVLFKDHTETFLYGNNKWYNIDTCCGLSTYVIQDKFITLNNAYRFLDWYLAVYP